MKTYLFVLIALIVVFLATIYGVSQNEYFGNYGLQKKNNLIHNGSFENGIDITEKIKVEGNNQIVILENPGASSYVLKQSFVPNAENYYLLRVKVEPNEHYLLSFYYHCENGSDLEETLLKLEIRDKNNQNYVIKGNTSIKEKAIVDGREWYRVNFNFQTPANLLDNYLYIYIGYNMTNGIRYYTDVRLDKYLTDAPKFNVTNGLQVLLEGANLDPAEHIHNMIWKDSSEKGHDFEWFTKPNYHPDGYYQIYGNSLEGGSGKDILNENQFTVGINVEVTESMPKPTNLGTNTDANTLTNNYRELIRIPGNNNQALQVWLPLFYGKMVLIIGDVKYHTDKDVISHNNNTYSFVYDGICLKIYVNNALISSITPRYKIHFNNQPIVINYNRNMRANLYNVIMYNRVLSTSEIAYIVKYFSQGGVASTASTPIRWFQNLTTPSLAPFVNPGLTPVSNQGLTSLLNPGLTPVSNQNLTQILTPSCQIGPGSNSKKKCVGGGCPQVVCKNNEYFVYIPSGSPLEKLVGYCGYKSYGKSQGNAKKIFQLNFPECPVPDVLSNPAQHPNFNRCPYVVRKGNPCFSKACAGVDWSVKNPTQANLSNKCKEEINHYCEKNSSYDPACACWKPPARDTRECVDFRRNFLNPNDYQCKVDYFKIEEHPDISGYIRKDRIPCWGCNIPNENSKNDNSKNCTK